MYALVTAILPFPAPARKRTTTAIQSAEARPKEIRKIVFEISPNISIGRRPTLSESEPRIGVNRN